MPKRNLGKRALDRVAWALVACVGALVACLPWRALRSVGVAVGWLASSVVRLRRRDVETHLAGAGLDRSLAPAVYRSLGASLCELLWAERRPASALADHVILTPRAAAAIELARKNGAVIATAHVGSWDVVGCAIASRAPLSVLTKRLSNEPLDRRWQGLRAAKGVSLISGPGALARCREALTAKRMVAMMIDQVPPRKAGAIEALFLGQNAFHDSGPAALAARSGVPFVVAFGRRLDDGSHEVDVPLILTPRPREGLAFARRATLAASAELEQHVRAWPEQFFWLHRRWKQPATRGTRPAWTTSSASARTRSAPDSSWAPESTRT